MRWVRSPNRQLNAAINLYMRMSFGYTVKWVGGRKRVQLKMEGASQMVGPRGAPKPCGWVLTGAELKGTSEPVRLLYDAVKPKLHYAYERYADAYLCAPT